jgi:pyridoxal phosphate enzyme (YggS family)
VTSSPPAFDPVAALRQVRQAITASAAEAGRAPEDVTLVAVSKQQPLERVEALLAAGQRVFGENRVQEAQSRWEPLRPLTAGLELRLIGPLQTNKAADAVVLFEVIETLDRERLAAALAAAMAAQGRKPRLYIQVNTGEEPQKAGVPPREAEALLRAARETHGLLVEGLMCIPPADEPAGLHFALLRKLAADLGLSKLSMGMSADYRTAVRFGATSVRVGSALFGARG